MQRKLASIVGAATISFQVSVLTQKIDPKTKTVDVKSRLTMVGLGGEPLGDVALPGAGSLSGFLGRGDSNLFFYAFTSHLYPTTVFAYDIKAGTTWFTDYGSSRNPEHFWPSGRSR